MLANKKGRPRLNPYIRTLVVQKRASNPQNPPSIDKIIDWLQENKIDPLPGRGSVQNIIREWESKGVEIRERDMPFTFSQLEKARIPFEAAKFVQECKYVQETAVVHVNIPETLSNQQVIQVLRDNVFTNRLGYWCWRVHCADTGMKAGDVLTFAHIYAVIERIHDFVPGVSVPMHPLDDVLAYRPYSSKGALKTYLGAAEVGLVQPIPPRVTIAIAERHQGLSAEDKAWLERIIRLFEGVKDPWSIVFEEQCRLPGQKGHRITAFGKLLLLENLIYGHLKPLMRETEHERLNMATQ